MTTLDDVLNELSPERRRWVDERSEALKLQERSLRELREALEATQAAIAQRLREVPEAYPPDENRGDLLLSTLAGFVEAAGGALSIVVRYPGRPAVALSGITAIDEHPEPDAADFALFTLKTGWDEPEGQPHPAVKDDSQSAA